MIEKVLKNTSLVTMLTYENFLENLRIIENNIAEACKRSGRGLNSVTLLPVTKTQPAKIIEYVSRAGLSSVGENRVQEASIKKLEVTTPLKWELIGHLQTNKVAAALEIFYRIQSVDSKELLLKLETAAAKNNRRLPILLQVNAGKDPAKFGIDPEEIDQVFEFALNLKQIQIDGLMTIPPLSNDLSIAQYTFDNLRNIQDRLIQKFKVTLPELSMGMSKDYIQAIKAGSTIIRIGTDLFGKRTIVE